MAELSSEVYDFKTFIDDFSLPQVVKVIEGVYGNEDELTLSTLEVIHLHLIKNCETVIATDERNREFYLPLNSPAKVKVLPNPIYQELYVNVRKLAQDFPTFVEAYDDYSELNIEMGDVLKLKNVSTNPHNEEYLKCECTNKEKEDILIPFSYKTRFKTLGDFGLSVLFLKEVVAKTTQFPVLVEFQDSILKARRRDINGGCPTGFDQLGILSLKEAFVMKLVVATSCSADHGSERTLLTIPHDLDIKVSPVLDKNERSAYQKGKHSQIGSFKIDFNETSFRYGCNVIENPQGHTLSKQGNIKKTIPLARNRVTSGVTSTSSSQICDGEQTINNSCDVSSCSKDETEKEMTRAVDIERRVGITSSSKEKVEDDYEDMSFCKDVLSKVRAGKSELLTQQQSKNYEATAAATAATAAAADDDDDAVDDDAAADDDDTAAAADDDADDNDGDAAAAVAAAADDDPDDNDAAAAAEDDDDDAAAAVAAAAAADDDDTDDNDDDDAAAADDDGGDDGKDGHLATCHIPSSHGHTSRDINDETEDLYDIPVIPSSSFILLDKAASPPGSIVPNPRDDTDDDVFQSGQGHLGLPPLLPGKPRSVSFYDEEEEEESGEQYVCMKGEVAAADISVLPEEHQKGMKTRRMLSDLGPSRISTSSDSSSTSSPLYDVPPSTSQTKSKKPKSKIQRSMHKLAKMSRSALKRSKSTTDMPSEDYQYVESIPEAQADKQTEIGKLLSYFQKSKKPNKGSKDLTPVDCLSTFTVDEVSESLKSLNLHRYVETFRANTVDGSLFMDLNDTLLDELEVTRGLDRVKIRKLQKEGWTPKYN